MQYDAAPDEDVFVVGSMTQLAHYVYQDYHLRIDALRAQAEHRHKLKVCCNIQYMQVFTRHGTIQDEACYNTLYSVESVECRIYCKFIFWNTSRTFDHQICLQFLRCDLYSESVEDRGVVSLCLCTCLYHVAVHDYESCYTTGVQLVDYPGCSLQTAVFNFNGMLL